MRAAGGVPDPASSGDLLMLPVANNVRAEREARGMTQSDLGVAIGLTRQTIAAIEQRRYSPSLEAAFRIAILFEMTVDSLFYWEG
jgi:putative transcriptional regulator